MKKEIGASLFGVGTGSSNSNYFITPHNKNKWREVDSFSYENRNSLVGNSGLIFSQKKINLLFILLIFGMSILFFRAAYLQLFLGEHYRTVAEGNRIRIQDIKAARGIIYDQNLKPLVENVPIYSLGIVPVDLPKDEKEKKDLANQLASISGQSSEEIYKQYFAKIVFSYQPIIISENLTPEQAILTRILSAKYSGVVLQINSTRHYLTASTTESFSHVLGYNGKIEESKRQEYLNRGYIYDDYVGKTGLESIYEKELKGVNGKEQVEVDATGQAKEILASQKPQVGANLLLSINADLQNIAEASLKKILSANGKKKGSVIALDPNNGEILAMVSLPAFDNNLFSRGISQSDFNRLINDIDHPLFNRSISGEYPPGSTFKLIVGGAALQEGVANESTTFSSTGGIYVNKWFFPDWKAGGHGMTNIVKALAESINTYFYIVGGGYNDFKGLGPERLKKYSDLFGLGNPLGIDLPNEAGGFVPSVDWKKKTRNEMWYIGDTYHFAIGQGDLTTTPLQIASWTAFFANSGTIYQPHVVRSIMDSKNQEIKKIESVIINKNFISDKNIKIVQRGLRQAVLTGSGRRFSTLPFEVAAKTGTAQWSQTKLPQAWVTAYAPYEKPNIVVTVLVEEGGEGSSVAVPIAFDILNWWANKDKPLDIASSTPSLSKE